jgi:hypothetical protein
LELLVGVVLTQACPIKIAFLFLLFVFSSVKADGLPTPFSAYYKGPLWSKTCVTLSRRPGGLVYKYHTKVLGYWFDETSFLRVKHDHLYPAKFQHRQKDRSIETVFDREKGTIKTTQSEREDHEEPFPSDGEVWDLLSFQLKLMTDLRKYDRLATLRKHEALPTFTYRIVDKRGKIKTYRASVVGFEKVKTKEGYYGAWKVKRADDKEFYVWFAPALNYVPVRIQKGLISVRFYSRSCEDLM